MKKSKNKSDQRKVIKSFFNRTSEDWDNLYQGESFIDQHMKDRKQIVLNLVEKYSNGSKLKILDLGCGSGILTKELVDKGHTVAGADIAEEMIIKLNSSIKKNSGKKYLGSAICDAGLICFAMKTFDIVLCIGVLQYQLSDDKILKEIDRVLSPGGICIATFPNLLRINYFFDPLYYFKFIYRFMKKEFIKLTKPKSNNELEKSSLTGTFQDDYPYDKKYYLGTVKELITKNKFDIKKIVSFGYGPFTIFNKKIFSDHISFTISSALDRVAHRSKLNLFNYTANRWVCVVKKNMQFEKNNYNQDDN